MPQAAAENRLAEDRRSRRAISSHVAGLARGLTHEAGPNVLDLVPQFDFLGDGHAVLGDGWTTPRLVDHRVSAAGTQCRFHRGGEFLDPAEQGFASVCVKGQFLGGHGLVS